MSDVRLMPMRAVDYRAKVGATMGAGDDPLGATVPLTDLEIRNATDLQPAASEARELVILVAAFLGKTRLIDNLLVELDA